MASPPVRRKSLVSAASISKFATGKCTQKRSQRRWCWHKKRDELIEKKLVERQAAYLLISLRQRILNVPQTYCRKMVGLKDARQASEVLREMAISVLNEIKDLPSKVVDRDWLEKVEEGDV